MRHEFTVGVPARFNTQQGTEAMDISLYPETHPLSYQSPSMYWGWSFGYMYMIIGGGEGSNYFGASFRWPYLTATGEFICSSNGCF